MSNIVYQEKFLSWPIIGFVLIIDLLILVTLHASTTSIFLVVASLFLLLNIYSLSIELEGNSIYYSFGLGLIASSISANNIEAFDIQDINSLLPWVYNPKGTQSLVVKLRNNRIYRLPSREPKRIINYLQTKI